MLLITVLQYIMLFAAISSWIPQLRGSRLVQVLHMLTEPIVSPFRKLLQKTGFLQGFPLDISFLLAYITLSILRSLL